MARRTIGSRMGRLWGCLVLSTFAAMAIGAATSAASSPPVDPFPHAVLRLEDALRLAIEKQPQELTLSLVASERVCGLGESAEARGEAAAAAADWSALAQAVERLDEPALRSVEEAFDQASSRLSRLEAKSTQIRPEQPGARYRRSGMRAVRHGIRLVTTSLGRLDEAFSAWKAQSCEGARTAIATSQRGVVGGTAEISRGMIRLWRSIVL